VRRAFGDDYRRALTPIGPANTRRRAIYGYFSGGPTTISSNAAVGRVKTMQAITARDVVQGEKLQGLASISLVTPRKLDYIRQYGDPSPIRRLVLPGDHFHFAEITDEDVAFLAARQCTTLFVFGSLIDSFMRVVAPRLVHRYVLITHNGDEPIDDRYLAYLNADARLIHWFAQNAMIDHPKLSALPIGIANGMWPHGDAEVVARAHHRAVKDGRVSLAKDMACYVYFDERTNYAKRQPAWVVQNHFPKSVALPYPDYMDHLARHRFCICPEGNGPDTHRLWEALYVGTIPIVLPGPLITRWQNAGVPLVVVDGWEHVTPEFINSLDHASLAARAVALPLLRTSYWRDLVRAKVE